MVLEATPVIVLILISFNGQITEPYCTSTWDENGKWISDCGNYAAAIIYFISFYVIVSFMFVNLFIGKLVELVTPAALL